MTEQPIFADIARPTATDAVSADPRMTRTIWVLIILMAFCTATSLAMLGIRVDFSSNPPLIATACGYAIVAVYYTVVRREPRLTSVLIATAQLFLVLFIGLLLTYAASAVDLPYRDANLQLADLWLGFNRESYRTFASLPGFGAVLDTAYLSIQPQTALVPLALILAGQLPRLQQFIMAFGLALSATALIAAFVPAMDAMIYLDLAPNGISALPPGTYTHIPTLEALRAGTMTTIRLNNLEGLITFPSFHTASGVMFTWALWRIRYLRIAGLILNSLLIASTPISGSHYLIDVIAGAGVAWTAIVITGRLTANSARNYRVARIN
ncbi:MAG TPA: phosphatase PAP2 family protein [Nitrobacter sp.]|jgi:membrane-associated phospholipid phosphatase|nr:phosphatase PAP2 family protein [Nitrobacter sp.]